MNVSRHVLRILTAAGFFFPAWPLAVYGREDEEPHAAAAVEEDSPVSGKDDIVVRPVNITGKVFSLDGSGSVDHFFFLPTMKDSREFFKVARPFVPVTGHSVRALTSERVRWFSKAWNESVLCRDMEEEGVFEIDLGRIDRENGTGFWVVRMPAPSALSDSEEAVEPETVLPPEEGKTGRGEGSHGPEDVKTGELPGRE